MCTRRSERPFSTMTLVFALSSIRVPSERVKAWRWPAGAESVSALPEGLTIQRIPSATAATAMPAPASLHAREGTRGAS